MRQFTIHFEMNKETKNTFRYAEVVPADEGAVIGYLYVNKEAFGEADAPERVKVVVKAD